MPLSAADIAALSQLYDLAQALPAGERQAWLDALPPEQAHLRAPLQRMLDTPTGTTDDSDPLAPLTRRARLPDRPAPDDATTDDDSGTAPGGERPGDLIGPYRLLRLLGRGGMGSVWLAERADGAYEREVAIKLPRWRVADGTGGAAAAARRAERLADRMLTESRIAARLEHPHIARLYDAGLDAMQRPYLVMECVRGAPLLASPALAHAGRAERLQWVLQACSAVSHAHALLVVHRDIKPSNLMLDNRGQIKLLDFGIARMLDADTAPATAANASDLQRTHTPGYAAPEQLRGEPVSTATDQFALAVVAHELLTGRRPVGGRPDPALGRDLKRVLARALRDAPAERHSSVERFADELRRVLAQQPLQSDPGPWLHRLGLLLQRRRVEAVGAAVALLLAGTGLTLLLQEQARTRAEAVRTAQAREFLFDLLEDTEPLQGQRREDVTGAQMLQSALQRAQQGFDGQPVLRGDVLVQLGLMLRRFNQGEAALQALEQGHELLAAHAPPGDAARARAAAQLAMELLYSQSGQAERAAGLAEGALRDCIGVPAADTRCTRARAYAHWALVELHQRRGDVDTAVHHAGQGIVESAAAFGAEDAETVLARLRLAGLLRNAGRLTQAAQALTPLRDPARMATLRAADLQHLHLWHALIQGDLGSHAEALQALDSLLSDDTAAFLHVAALRLKGQNQLALGLFQPALSAIDAGLARASSSAREHALLRPTRARALALLGQHSPAAAELEGIDTALAALGMAADGVERLRVERIAAELALRAGREAEAEALLAPLPARHGRDRVTPTAPVDLAQVLDLQAAMARRAADETAALRLHQEAARWLAQQLPAEHPLRLRNDVDQALARALAPSARDRRATATPELRAAVDAYLAVLPLSSGWRPLLERMADDPDAARMTVL
jgi:serine/threonine-protein kinase